MTSMFKPRGGFGGFSREQAAKHKSAGHGGGQNRSQIAGLYDDYYPTLDKVWVSLCPTQVWDSLIYNREKQEVEPIRAEYFAHVVHRVGATGRKFVCSSTAYKNQPCYGCSERERFFVKRREIQTETGTIPKSMENAPISAMQQFAISLTMVEEVGEYAKLDKVTGQPIMTKKQKPIFQWRPTRWKKGTKEVPRAKAPGRRFHWSFGSDHLSALIAEMDKLSTRCAACAGRLTALYGTCAGQTHDGTSFDTEGNPILTDCETMLITDPVSPEEMAETVAQNFECYACGNEGKLDFVYSCENCGIDCKPGGLFDFELLLGARADDDHTPTIYDFRPRRDYSGIADAEELIFKPLDLPNILAPKQLKWQLQDLSPERAKTATPDAHIRKEEAGSDQSMGEGESNEPINY